VYVCRLRKALGFDAIETVWGLGFRLAPRGRARIEAKISLPLPYPAPIASLAKA
jgi:hypothetical protein